MKKKKLLILSASTGSGHIQAGNALYEHALRHHQDTLEVKHVDIAEYLSFPVKTTLVNSYAVMIKTLPELWGLLYKQSDRPNTGKYLTKLMQFIKQINSSALYEMINEFEPDCILYTHFLGHYFVEVAPPKWKLHMKTAMLFTDYAIHNILVVPEVDHFFVPTEKMKWIIEKNKTIHPDRVTLSGIPVRPEFFEPADTKKLKKKHGIDPKLPVLLVLAGGYGLSKSDAIISTLFNLETPHQLIAIAGKNDRLVKRLQALNPPDHHQLTVHGWTDQMHELMHIADAIISKPGGVTLTEAHTITTPLIAINPIPGQEDRNAHHMLEHNWGALVHDPNDLLYYASHIDTIGNSNTTTDIPASEIIIQTLFT